MKKLISCLVLSAVICGAFASCGKSSSSSSSSEEAATEAATEATTEAAEENATAAAEEEDETVAIAVDDVDFEDAVEAKTGDAYLAYADSQWWIQSFGNIDSPLTYDAGVAEIKGNGDYTVSLTSETNGFRFDTTGDPNGEYYPSGANFMAVVIKDAETALPDAIITINSIKVNGKEVEMKAKNYTNTEDGSIRSNIYNAYVEDSALPGDARTADGFLFNNYDTASPNFEEGEYSAKLIDAEKDLSEWKTIEVNFTVSGLAE